jgi:hypothetical protein
MVVKKLIEEYEPKVEKIEEKIKEEVEKIVEERIPLIGPEEVEEEVKRPVGRPRLTEEEKRIRKEERRVARPMAVTPYVGGILPLEDSGGWCLTESKTVTTTVDRRIGGGKTIMINDLEVIRR